MRRLAVALAVAAALAVAGALALDVYLGPLIKAAAERLGPQVAGVPVRLASVSVSPLSGRLSLGGLVIGNPPGFRARSALEVREVRVSLSLRSLFADTVRVKEVLVRGASATLELGPDGSNMAVIARRVEAYAGGAPAPRPARRAKRLAIADFRFEDGAARLAAGVLGGSELVARIPDIHLTGIGGEEGTTPARAAAQALAPVAAAVTRAAFRQRPLRGVLKEAGKALAPVDKALAPAKTLLHKARRLLPRGLRPGGG